MQRRWIFPTQDNTPAIQRFRRELNLPDFLARLMSRQGFHSLEEASDFLHPRLRNLADPFLLPDMEAAAERTAQAIREREKIVLYGDYDVDGVASLSLLHRILSALGADVECFLPHRHEEGYGLSAAGLERCFETTPPRLLIAVDCGTNSAREVAWARAHGADVVILDHHESSDERPDCAALVNPKLNGGDFGYLCSVGVSFKLAHALLKKNPRPEIDLKSYLDIVALGTVADIVPLVGENRIMVSHGLRQMENTRWPGLAALMRVTGVHAPISTSDIGFRLGPRINASGRLGTALESLRLLLSDDRQEAFRLAESLDKQNRDRQYVERHLIQEVEAWVAANYLADRDACIIAGQKDWHHGVLGIVASRIMRQHHRPTLLVGFDEDGLGKGSGRSIEGVSLVAALSPCALHLEKFGGHEMAAGVTVQEERFDDFRTAFQESARNLVNEEILTPKLRLDAEIPLADISHDFLESQQLMAPFGTANRQPVFAVRAITPAAEPRVLKEKHLRFDFRDGRRHVSAIFFQGATEPLPRPPWDVAFTLERSEYNGRVEVQMQVKAIRSAE